jgi:Tfp pilus assembly protein PilV
VHHLAKYTDKILKKLEVSDVVISSKAMNKYQKGRQSNKDQGFGLLEAAIALTTLGITLAYAMPLFLYSKMNNSKSETRTGSMMIAQRVLDTTRGMPFASIPSVGTVTWVHGGTAADGSTINLEAIGGSPQPVTGIKLYEAKTYHCEVASECDANYKTVRVEIKKNGSPIYEMSAGYTNFR